MAAVRGRVVSGKDAVKDGMKVTVDWRPTARELGEYSPTLITAEFE